MALQRKVFRVEKMAATQGEPPSAGNSDLSCCEELIRQLAALRALLAAALARSFDTSVSEGAEIRRLASRLGDINSAFFGAEHGAAAGATAATSMNRVAHELDAAVQASEQATQKILTAAEDIDQAANNLSAVVKGDSEQGLAQDIRDRVITIFEACNFQDVTSQRLAKVKTALAGLDKLIGEALGDSAPPAHGPPLDGDDGHASQSEVDSLFAGVRFAPAVEERR